MNLESQTKRFHEDLRESVDAYAHLVYDLTVSFPKYELYGVVSQVRRVALSVVLNYIEGYARQRDKVHKNFLEIAYGSLKESEYLLKFSLKRGYIVSADEYEKAINLADKIGGMLWVTINNLKSN